VKAALKRGRSKLATLPERAERPRARNADVAQLLHLYVDRFNQRDWDGVRELIAADARVKVADRFLGPASDSPYFRNYERWTVQWRMAVGEVDGKPVIITLHRDGDEWAPRGPPHHAHRRLRALSVGPTGGYLCHRRPVRP
jgi:RNA polymerase sigma-70 factor (ECF subfamily)